MTHGTTTERDAATRLIEWFQANRRLAIGWVAAIVVVGGAVLFYFSARARRETFAANSLDDARVVLRAGNLPLAASDLSRLASTFRGTRAADEAVVLLAQVRLSQGQAAEAITVIRQGLESGLEDQFVAPANAILGAALEQTGDPSGGAAAYVEAARRAWYGLVEADYLMEAARLHAAAGDTAAAMAVYRRITDEFEESVFARTARLRLAELEAASGGS